VFNILYKSDTGRQTATQLNMLQNNWLRSKYGTFSWQMKIVVRKEIVKATKCDPGMIDSLISLISFLGL